MSLLRIFNRQKTRRIDAPLLRKITHRLLADWQGLTTHELAIHLVEPEEMARVNKHFLNHDGSTDVITFDNRENEVPGEMAGELYICIQDAIDQAREFGTIWQSELARYVAHGLLHLRGFDDLKPALRRVMKREENRLVGLLNAEFDLAKLEKTLQKRPNGKQPKARGRKP